MPRIAGAAATSRDKAYAHLRDHVLIDPAMQGQFLNEQKLAAEIGVSRTPVREALLLLASDGLVNLIPQRGAYIPAVTGREISELMEMRGALESLGARLAIASGNVPLEAMAEILSRQTELPDNLEPEATRKFIRLDTLFHQLLVDAAGNELMSRTYSKLHVRQMLVGVAALTRIKGRRRHVCEEHQEILEALKVGDVQQAQQAIERHLAITEEIFLRA